MSLLFVDGFDYYDNTAQLEKKWSGRNGGSWTSTQGRFGEGGYKTSTNDTLWKTVSRQQTLVGGAAVKAGAGASFGGESLVFRFQDRGHQQLKLVLNADGTLSVKKGGIAGDPGSGAVLGTSSEALNSDQWFYIEWKAVIDDSNGSFEVRVNEETWINVSGVDTDDQSTGNINGFYLGDSNGGPDVTFDDVYIIDTSGSQNNDFLGDVKVETLLPDSDETVEWVPDSGNTNYQMVDDESLDTGNTFNSSDTVGNTDRFSFTDLADNPNDVNAVVMSAVGQKTDAGTVGITNFVRVNSSNSTASEQLLTSDYLYEQSIFPNQPSGSSWTGNPINQMSAGYHHSS